MGANLSDMLDFGDWIISAFTTLLTSPSIQFCLYIGAFCIVIRTIFHFVKR